MTQENKELLKDLCARLPYEVIVECSIESGESIDLILNTSHIDELVNNSLIIKPYIRPMSSMTKEELHEVQEILGKGVEIHDVFIYIVDSSINTFSYLELQAVFDWLNKKMFDYRGLIKKGLALEAPVDMYNLKDK